MHLVRSPSGPAGGATPLGAAGHQASWCDGLGREPTRGICEHIQGVSREHRDSTRTPEKSRKTHAAAPKRNRPHAMPGTHKIQPVRRPLPLARWGQPPFVSVLRRDCALTILAFVRNAGASNEY